MLWGAIAGTIPDLDVIGNAFMSEIDSLAFHRGISHSLLFAVVFSFLIAAYTRWFYASGVYRNLIFRRINAGVGTLLLAAIGFGIAALMYSIFGMKGAVITGVIVLANVVYFGWRLWVHYAVDPPISVEVSYKQWYIFFFLTIFTHPILDACTVYGTQLWAPFSNMRVAWNNISVADPLWTFPFALSLIAVGMLRRNQPWRRYAIILGWVWALGYMGYTFYNKYKVDQVMENTIASMGLKANKYMVNPTILNNILWSGTVETDSIYYQGLYSFNDQKKEFKLYPIPKNHHLVRDNGQDKVLNTLKWFSKDYYGYMIREDGRIQMNDLRYGTFRGNGNITENDFIFRFILEPQPDGSYALGKAEGGPPPGAEDDMMNSLLARIRGI